MEKKKKIYLSLLLVLISTVVVIFGTSFSTASTASEFSDVNEEDWFLPDVMYVNEKGLMSGTGETAFSPYDATTRGMTSITVTGNVDKSKIYATAELLGVWYKNINGTDTQAKRIKYNLDFYYIGKDLHIKGYVYDTTNASSAKRIDVDSQHVKDTHTSDKNCPCGRGSGCNHGIDWIISGWYNGGIPAIHTWSSGYPDPIRLR